METTTKTRVPSQERSRKRVETILSVAKSIIERKGCAGLAMSEIAKEAGISHGSVYQYFPNRGAVIAALWSDYLDANSKRIEEALADPPEDCDALLELLMQLLEEYYRLHREDPFLRDVWAGFSSDKNIRDLDADDTRRNVNLIFERTNHLFKPSCHDIVRRRMLLMMNIVAVAVETAIDQGDAVGRLMMNDANEMLRLSWTQTIKPLAI